MSFPVQKDNPGDLTDSDFPLKPSAEDAEPISSDRAGKVTDEPSDVRGQIAISVEENVDRQTIVEATITGKLADMFDRKTLHYIVFCVNKRNHAPVIENGDDLVDPKDRFTYFLTMHQLMPDGITYARKIAEAGYMADLEALLHGTLAKMTNKKIWDACRHEYVDHVLYPPVSKPRSNAKIITACALLEEELTDPNDMASYAYLAFKLGDHRRLQIAMGLMEENLDNNRCLTTYSFINRKIRNPAGIDHAFTMMQERLDNKYVLIEYGVIARSRGDIEAMEIACGLLAERLDDERCLNLFSILANELGLVPEVDAVMPTLEKHLTNPYVLTTYASIARQSEDLERMNIAVNRIRDNITDGYVAHMFAVLALELQDTVLIQEAQIAIKPFLSDKACEEIYTRLCEYAGHAQ